MQRLFDWTDIPEAFQGASVAMGNFDGLHLGHQALLDMARASGPLGVVTFEPHPRDVFRPNSGPFRLMSPDGRARALQAFGVERLFELHFDAALAAMTAEEFARDVLAGGLGVRHVTVGEDFHFGHARTGTAATLADLGAKYGFGVSAAPLLRREGRVISSTAIRQALSDGRIAEASAMLGHPHRIEGAVAHGDKRGRLLGFPTANLGFDGLLVPRFGIYAVRVDVLTGAFAGTYGGVSSLGVRPTFGVNAPNFETFLFDFSGDLYGQQISVALLDYLRPELKFDGVEALIEQMNRDSAAARRILAEA